MRHPKTNETLREEVLQLAMIKRTENKALDRNASLEEFREQIKETEGAGFQGSGFQDYQKANKET